MKVAELDVRQKMYPFISLILRILSGERLEPATKRNAAYWLSALVVIPPGIVGSAFLAGWLESLMWSPFDHAASFIFFMVIIGLVFLGAVFSLAKICRDHPGFLLLLSCGAWGVTAFLMYRHF